MSDLKASPQCYIPLELLYYSRIVLGLGLYLQPNFLRAMNIKSDSYYPHEYIVCLALSERTQTPGTVGQPELASGLAHRKLDRILGRACSYVPGISLLRGQYIRIFIDHAEFITEADPLFSLSYQPSLDTTYP